MSTKCTIQFYRGNDTLPAWHFYEEAFEEADFQETFEEAGFVYLQLTGVQVDVVTIAEKLPLVVLRLPTATARQLGLFSTGGRPTWIDEARARQTTPVLPRQSSHWDYRVIEFATEAGESWRSIHEVRYVNDVPAYYSEKPATATWDVTEGEAGPLAMLERMRVAVGKPVLMARDLHSTAP